MKKALPYIFIGLVVVGAAILIFVRKKQNRFFDKTVTLKRSDKIPYGTFITYQMLPVIFSQATITNNKKAPNDWYDADSAKLSNQLFFLISKRFNPDRIELDYLRSFVEKGNIVFICTNTMNEAAQKYFGLDDYSKDNYYNDYSNHFDSVYTYLSKPPFHDSLKYFNAGFTFNKNFKNIDTSRYTVLGRDNYYQPNLIKISALKGSFYLHSDPFLFANYFLLQKNNKTYFENVLSCIPATTKKIIWDEYYVNKQEEQQEKDSSPWRVLFSYEAFKWAFWLLIILLALFTVLNSKRPQRIIPVFNKPKNDSLEFAKTIGRLYFEKQDHYNLAQKMCTYFLEFVRTKYIIGTSYLNEDFVKKLSGKSGYPEEKVMELVSYISQLQSTTTISEQQLGVLYNQFQNFYKTVS